MDLINFDDEADAHRAVPWWEELRKALCDDTAGGAEAEAVLPQLIQSPPSELLVDLGEPVAAKLASAVDGGKVVAARSTVARSTVQQRLDRCQPIEVAIADPLTSGTLPVVATSRRLIQYLSYVNFYTF